MFKTYGQAIVDSFYNPRVYRDAIARWTGFGGAYMALVALILAVFLVAVFLIAVNTFEKTELPHILKQVPAITIKNGMITLKEKQPVVISSSNKKLTATIDTEKSESELRDTKTTVGIGKTFVFFQGNGEYQVSYLEQFRDKNVTINKENLLALWQQIMPLIKVLAVPLMWLGQLMNLVVKCVIVALTSYIVTAFLPEEYIFLTRMRLAALALTPACIISMALLLFANHETAPWFEVLLATLYIYAMIILMRRLPPAAEAETVAV